MKLRFPVIGFILLLLGVGIGTVVAKPLAAPAGNAFTYRGYLTLSGSAVTDSCDFEFTLYDADVAGSMVGSPVAVNALAVNSGQFTTSLDFGASPFGGDARWLEIKVRCPAGSGVFTTLTPRQELTAVPYALFSFGAPWGGITGIPADIADGDDDSFADLSCDPHRIPYWNGTAWVCAPDSDTQNPALLNPGYYHNEYLSDAPEMELVDIAIGVDGLPNIVHVERGIVYLTRCANMECSTLGEFQEIGRGQYPGIAIGPSGAPLIVYNDGTDVTLTTCDDVTCKTFTTEVVGPGYGHPDIVVSGDGLPLIAVKDYETDFMSLYYPVCSGSCAWVNVTLDHATYMGAEVSVIPAFEHASIELWSPGAPVISYWVGGERSDVVAAMCFEPECTNVYYEVFQPGGSFYSPPQGTSLALIPDEDWWKVVFASERLYHGNIVPPNPGGSPGGLVGVDVTLVPPCLSSCPGGDGNFISHNPSVAIDEHGNEFVVYAERWTGNVYVWSAGYSHVIGQTNYSNGTFSSAITIGADGLPIIAFVGANGGDAVLQTVHCSNTWCIPYYRRH